MDRSFPRMKSLYLSSNGQQCFTRLKEISREMCGIRERGNPINSNKCVHPRSSEIFVATSLEDSPSSTTFRSTPRSADASEPQHTSGKFRQRTKASKSTRWCSLSFSYEYG